MPGKNVERNRLAGRFQVPVLALLLTVPVLGGAFMYSSSFSSSGAAKKQAAVPVQAAGRGAPWLSLHDGIDLATRHTEPSGAERALVPAEARSTALAAGDFNGDGWDDLVGGYRTATGGIVTLHLADSEALSPGSPDSLALAREGRFRPPFLSNAVAVDVAVAPDFVAAGDFNADTRTDVLVASRGGTELMLIPGDGEGGFGSFETISLPGRVTTLAVGDLGTPDGLKETVVGLSRDSGGELLVFKGIDGGLKAAPETIPLSGEARFLSFGTLDGRTTDMAVAVARDVLVVRDETGTDRVERISLDSNVTGLAFGEFAWTRAGHDDLAVLDETGTLRIVVRGPIDRAPLTLAERKALFKRPRTATEGNGVEPAARFVKQDWKTLESFSLGATGSGTSNALLRARLSGMPTEDVLVLGANRLHVVVGENPKRLETDADRRVRPAPVALDVDGQTVAALPMRLSAVARQGLIVLREGASVPTAITVKPAAVFNVNTTTDTTTCGGTCSLRGAVIASNSTAGPNVINVPAGTYTLTLGPADDDDAFVADPNAGDLDFIGTFNGGANDSTSIIGAGAATTIIQAGASQPGLDRIIDVDFPFGGSAYALSISGVTLRHGRAALGSFGSGGDGGAIRFIGVDASFATFSTLTLSNCAVLNNTSTGFGFIGAAAGAVGAFGNVSFTGVDLSSNTSGFGAAGLNVAAGSGSTFTNSTFHANVGSDSGGAGALLFQAGPVSISRGSITNNQARQASGALFFGVSANVTNCTFSGNSTNGAPNRGAGLHLAGGTGTPNVALFHVTVASNSATGGAGGGVFVASGPGNVTLLTMRNTLVADNSATTGPDISGTVGNVGAGSTNNLVESTSGVVGALPGVGNITGIDPQLQALALNNGTLSHALTCASVAVNAGTSAGVPATDQHGQPRNFDTAPDIGAFEFQTLRPTTANAGPDQILCVTTPATLAANTPTSGVGSWAVAGGPSTSLSQFGNPASPTTTFTPAGGAGTYTLQWSISNPPCAASTDNVVLTFNAAPTASNAGPDQTICGAPATLGANTPAVGTGVWSVASGPSTSNAQFSSTTNPTATFTPAGGAGTYVLRWTISNAPCPASTDDVSITVGAAPTTANAGADQTLCVTTPATLAANTPISGVGTWSVLSGPSTSNAQFSSTSNPAATFTPAGGAGTYVLRWTISNPPCPNSTDDVALTFRAEPSTANAGPDQTICANSTATLAAVEPTVGAGAWSVLSGPNTSSGQISNVTIGNAIFTPLGGAGTYVLRWRVTNPPCTDSTDQVSITVTATATTSNAGPDQTLCVTTPATLAANTPTSGIGTWSVAVGPSTSNAQFSNVNSPTATFTPAGGAGTYSLRWTISNPPCSDSTDDTAITFNAEPTTSNAGADQTVCNDGAATLAANTPTSGAGSWSVVSGPSTSNAQFSNVNSPTPTFTPAGGAGTYVLRWTISNPPCASSSDDVTVTNEVVTVNPASVPAGTAGVPYSQTFTASGNLGGVTFGVTGSLPAGLALAGDTLSGTPTQTGNFNFTITATDSTTGCTGSRAYTLTINCPTITVNPASVPPGTAGVPYAPVTFTQTGGIAPVTFSLSGALPAGMTFGGATLSGTPLQVGVFPFTVTATDANGCTGNTGYTLTVVCATVTVGPATIPAGTAGTAYGQTFTASGTVGTVGFALTGALPTGLTFAGATLSGTPTQTGSFPITVTATDVNGCTGSTNHTLVINCPTITVNPASLPSATVGLAYSQTVTASAGIAPITFAVTAGALPAGLTLSTGGVLSGTPTAAGTFTFTITATDANGCTGSRTYAGFSVNGFIVRHAPNINGTVQGSLQMLLGESMTLNGGGKITADLFVPGTPTVQLNGNPNFGGTIVGSGSATPTGYTITLNGNATLGHLRTRTDPVTLPTVAAPPNPTGTRDVSLNQPSDSIGDPSTLRNLTLNGNVGLKAVPPGTYGNFTANGNNGFIFGVVGSPTPVVYNLQNLTLNGNSQLTVVGPVILVLRNGPSINGTMGSSADPSLLSVQIFSGGLTLNGGSACHGIVLAPNGTVTINSLLVGSVSCDRLTINGNGLLKTTP